MVKRILGYLLLCTLCSVGAAAASIVDDIVGQISKSDYTAYVQTLEGYGTRYYNTAGNTNAQNFIADEFASFGLDVDLDPFSYFGTQYNVVATLPGELFPDDIYIVGAHYDSIASPSYDAPGADDNATGTAAVLEIASVLSQYRFESTIRFVAFDAEEKGLKGSYAYADDAYDNGDTILGMINFDMIGYTGGNPDEDVEVFGDGGDLWLRAVMIESLLEYTSLPVEGHPTLPFGSDHVPFSSTNYPGSSSILVIEDTADEIWGGSNPYYHRSSDTSDHIDWDFATEITVAGAASLAELAVPVPLPESIALLAPGFLAVLVFRRKRASDDPHS